MSNKVCSIEGCNRPHDSKGLCTGHAKRRSQGKPIDETPLANRGGVGPWNPYKETRQGYMRRHRRVNGKIEWQYEHKVVMEERLGRKLRDGENVHHKNRVRNDNRIENLELWYTSQPPGGRVEDITKWAKSFLEDYGYRVEGPLN